MLQAIKLAVGSAAAANSDEALLAAFAALGKVSTNNQHK